MATPERVVIVGAGQAGARTAQALRENGFTGGITLFGAETRPPYERPPLSKEALTDTVDDTALQVLPADWYREHRVDLRLGTRVTGASAGDRRLHLDDGRSEPWDALVLATGSRLRRLPVPGADGAGVLYLRDRDDSLVLHDALRRARRLVVIGGGFIGLEVAASARTLGVDATVVHMGKHLLDRVLPQPCGEHFRLLHESHGVRIVTGGQAGAVLRDGSACRGVELADGQRLEADLVVVGIGVDAEDSLARSLDLELADGIRVDADCRTSVAGVYAVGDCASSPEPGSGRLVRLESWHNAEVQPRRAAAALLGAEPPPTEIPFFWTTQYDTTAQIEGLLDPDCEPVQRGTPGDDSLALFQVRDGTLAAAALINDPRAQGAVKRLIERRIPVSAELLADPEVSLRELVKRARPGGN